jgi:threonine dehydratase
VTQSPPRGDSSAASKGADSPPTLADLRAAAALVHARMAPTLQHEWPLLSERCGARLWLKHENHTPLGAFKVRGGIVYFARLVASGARPGGVICATRGNHGQSVAAAAAHHGLPTTIVVPHGNSREKNAAMRALGATLIEHGDDFQAALEHARTLAAEHGWHMVPSMHRDLVLGVASYALELFDAVAPLDAVVVPIGLGSGACGVLAARDALGLDTEVIGVVSEGAPAYALSLEAGRAIAHDVTTQLADGMACRVPDPDALAVLKRGLSQVVRVSDEQIAAAMRALFECTHQVAEGAGAAAFAAVMQLPRLRGRRVAAVLTGGNVDRDVYARVLQGSSR